MSPWPLGHIPVVNFIAIIVDKPDGPWTGKMAVQHEAGRNSHVINATKSHAATKESILLHSCRFTLFLFPKAG